MSEEYISFYKSIDKILLEEAIRMDCGICKCLYHGTSKKIANEIKNSGVIDTEYGEVGYLGRGFYCFHWDIEASRQWARDHYKKEPIAIITLEVDLGNTFFVCEELWKLIDGQAKRVKEKLSYKEKIGTIIEFGIKNTIIREYGIDIHTIGRAYKYNRYFNKENGKRKKIERPALMYCLKDDDMINEFGIYEEE